MKSSSKIVEKGSSSREEEASKSDPSESPSNRSSSQDPKLGSKRKRTTATSPDQRKKRRRGSDREEETRSSSSNAEEDSSSDDGRSSGSEVEDNNEEEEDANEIGKARKDGMRDDRNQKDPKSPDVSHLSRRGTNDAGSGSDSDSESDASPMSSTSETAKMPKRPSEKRSRPNGITNSSSSPPPTSSASTAAPFTPAHVPSFTPPTGFQKIHKDPSKTNSLASLLSPAHLENKEIWYITAPASLPVHTIKFAERDKPKQHRISVTHNGVDYELWPENGERPYLMQARAGGATYKPVQTGFTNVCALRRTIVKPATMQKAVDARSAGGSQAAAVATVPQVKQTPQQPLGLRQKNWASGFEEEDEKPLVQSHQNRNAQITSQRHTPRPVTNGVASKAPSTGKKDAFKLSEASSKKRRRSPSSSSAVESDASEEPLPFEAKLKKISVNDAKAIVSPEKFKKKAPSTESSDTESSGSETPDAPLPVEAKLKHKSVKDAEDIMANGHSSKRKRAESSSDSDESSEGESESESEGSESGSDEEESGSEQSESASEDSD